MGQNNALYLYDIARYRISNAPHHLIEDIEYKYSSAFRQIDSMKKHAIELAKQMQLQPKAIEQISKITDDSMKNSRKRVYATSHLPDGHKDDYVITFYCLPIDTMPEKEVFTYTLGCFLKAACYEEGKTLYDVCQFEHGPLYNTFDDMKPELYELCSGQKNRSISLPDAIDEIAMMSPSILNVGRWEETLTGEHSSIRNGEHDYLLKMFRVNIEG